MMKNKALKMIGILVALCMVFLSLCSCNFGKTKKIEYSTDYKVVTTEVETSQAPVILPLDSKVIVIDPGHGDFEENYQEQIAPWTKQTKNAFSTGTEGSYLTESDFNLIMANKVKALLESSGATVYLTREDNISISNIERAQFANSKNADVYLRIHADGNDDPSVKGISMQLPGEDSIGLELEAASTEIAQYILDKVLEKTGAESRGLKYRYDLTGLNWCEVPVVLIECGFMSNPDEDALLASDDYQNKLANGMYEGILEYFQSKQG